MLSHPDYVIPRSFGTHNGTFHADEVSACALLLLCDLIDPSHIVRSRDESTLAHCEFVCDVGGVYDPSLKRFDHHQITYKGDKSSAGLILTYLLDEHLLSSEECHLLQESVIAGVDAYDNGRYHPERGVATFSQVISHFAPLEWESPSQTMDEAFLTAVLFAKSYFSKLLQRWHYQLRCKDKVLAAMKQPGPVLLFEEAMPWMESFFHAGGQQHPARFIIMPAGEGWKLRGIPPSITERMKVRQPLPQSWAGLMDHELEAVSGIQGAIFCHKGRFMSVWRTREAALEACEKVLALEGWQIPLTKARGS